MQQDQPCRKLKLNWCNQDMKIKSAYSGSTMRCRCSAVGASAKCAVSCYEIENTKIDDMIYKNNQKSAAYLRLAMEVTIDEICNEMGWDPLEFRIKNVSKEGIQKVMDLDTRSKSEHWNSDSGIKM